MRNQKLRQTELKSVDGFMKSAVEKPEILQMAKAQATLRRWSEVVGPALAERSRPDRFSRGTVWVAVEGSAWAQELRMRKDMILARLTEFSGEPNLFLQGRFGVRPLPKAPVEEVPQDSTVSIEDYSALSIREIAEKRIREWKAREP